MTVEGTGPVRYVETWGKAGRSEVWTGSKTGKVVDKGVVEEPVNALVKCASVLPSKKDEKYVALTFDEGPSNQTEEIIRILQEKGVKATFFVSGDKVASNSAVVRAIAESGNEIGTNAYSDVDLSLIHISGSHPASLASAIIFGIALILEYLASTLYHAIAPAAAKRVFRIIDHSCIYVLIAGTYTPFCLITLGEAGGIPLCIAVWALAIAGVLFEAFMRERQPHWLTAVMYVAMGWLVLFRLPQLIGALHPTALFLLAAGGVCYTIGAVFYVLKKIRYMHTVFHVWVLAGSVLQFLAVVLFVI